MIRLWIMLTACASLVVLADCSRTMGPMSPLSSLADSVLSGKPAPTCATITALPGPGRAPFHECRTTGADTAVIVIRDATRVVVLVSRQWRLAESGADTTYTSLLERVTSQLGQGEPTCQDPSLTGTMWTFPDRHVILGLLAEGEAYAAMIAGVPLCQ